MDAESFSPITPNELSELLRAFPPPMVVRGALYAWCRQARGETHGRDPARIRAQQRDALRT
jgi:hypothetical protein